MNKDDIIQQTVDTLLAGGTILYPTDTIWGVGCDARRPEAVERLYTIKERDHSKSMLVLVGENLNIRNNLIIQNNLNTPTNRPTTYILPRKIWHGEMHLSVANNLVAEDGSLGIRVPQHAFCQEVIRRLGAPLVSTSANFSGIPSPTRYGEIEEELKQKVDFCVPPLEEFMTSETCGSRIVKVEADGTVNVIRP